MRIAMIFLLTPALAAWAAEPGAIHWFHAPTPRIFTGASPVGDAAFAELSKRGVQTIISVDGARPDVEGAKRHGIRYVHLPIGYDGVSRERTLQMIRVVQSAEGPVFFHCHHGKHRGPAAAATVCRTLEGWDAQKAEQFLRHAGTSPDYAGLYRAVRESKPPTAEDLARLPAEFPEVATADPLVDAMVAIDLTHDALKAAHQANWREVPGSQQTPAQAAILLMEHFREMARTHDTAARKPDYRESITASEKAAHDLCEALNRKELTAAGEAMKRIEQQCTQCHKAHRN